MEQCSGARALPRTDLVVLLSATVDTNGCSMTARTDIETRKDDYTDALLYYLRATPYRVVLVENSGYDLAFLRALAPVSEALAGDKNHTGYAARLELISLADNTYPRHLGKGHGEQRTILQALAQSRMLNDTTRVDGETWIIKITGRLQIINLPALMNAGPDDHGAPRLDGVLATATPLAGHGAIPSQVFAFRLRLGTLFRRPVVDDSRQVYFEKLLAIVHAQCPSGLVHAFSEPPKIVGICGGDNVPYS